MDHETPDLIEAQMAETRQSLTDKVAALEDSVVGTMQNATAAVSDTVQSVKDAVGDTVNAVKDNVASEIFCRVDAPFEILTNFRPEHRNVLRN